MDLTIAKILYQAALFVLIANPRQINHFTMSHLVTNNYCTSVDWNKSNNFAVNIR
ncbi:hypothetical protein NTHI1209_00772 [Haemophilus influenzae]|uniref:Uncharacterized protein n=1 Tax=Haemophilus influenzae TaxID=727 RepID=A0A158SWC5_HAEIF|nr:hypothetical protein NTHI1209_00772 [Haemophilus influenzae]